MKTAYLVTAALGLALTACAAPKHDKHHEHHGHEHHNHNHHGHDHHGHHHGHEHAPDYTAWQKYQCANGKTLKVRYHHHAAEVQYKGKETLLKLNRTDSNDGVTVYGSKGLKWHTTSQHGYTNTKNVANGFLFHAHIETVNGEATPVEEILLKDCEPTAK